MGEKKIKEVLAKKAKVDETDITLTKTSIVTPSDPLQYTAVILASSHTTAATKVSAWEAMLLPAGRELQQFYKDSFADLADSAATLTKPASKYRVMVGITSTENEVASIDLDMVVHGVDLQALSASKKNAFLVSFASKVRLGLAP